jgi:tocopherol O-methyltransferase
LIQQLASRANLQKGFKVLDVGCGIGGTSMYLAKEFGCQVTGITISATQVEMANKILKERNIPHCRFTLMDAEDLAFEDNSFDVVWISGTFCYLGNLRCLEALSHFPQKKLFFQNASRVLKEGGKIVIADWFKREHLNDQQSKRFIKPIEDGMLLPELCTMNQYHL